MTLVNSVENEIIFWLEVILKDEELINLSVKIEGGTENGDGYIGDITFVEVNGTTAANVAKNYNLVLKCGKRNKNFRSKFPVNCAFLNEIYFYEHLQPCFVQFQKEKCVDDLFNKIPKCYGTFTADDLEVIVLENLKSKGYVLWDKKKPLTRKHIDLTIEEYAKFYSISLAMQDQQPEKFRKLAENLNDFLSELIRCTDVISTQEALTEEIYDLLQDDLPKDILLKWKNFKEKVRPFMTKVTQDLDGTKVIIHGDCWSNNFMHYYIGNEPLTLAILDWQLIKLTSPIIDLSYFLFACISEEDINDIDIILQHYYESLSNHLKKLGSNPKLYPFYQLLQDWKKYAKFGIIMGSLINKFALTENDEVPDMVKAAEEGYDITKSLNVEIKDKIGFQKRLRSIVKYVVEHDLI